MTLDGSQQKACFIVVVAKEFIIASDLESMIAEHVPDARIIVARTLAEASDLLPPDVAVDIAFVDTEPETFHRSSLSRRMASTRAYTVFLGRSWGNWKVPQNANWAVLDYPFRREDLRHVILGV